MPAGSDAARAGGAGRPRKTLEEGLAGCLVWLMFPELRIGPFVV